MSGIFSLGRHGGYVAVSVVDGSENWMRKGSKDCGWTGFISSQVIVLSCLSHKEVVKGCNFPMSRHLLPWSRISTRINSPRVYHLCLNSLTTTWKDAKLNVSLRKDMLRGSCGNAQ
jgi:hypothetical protein